jgi:hypothetical protein
VLLDELGDMLDAEPVVDSDELLPMDEPDALLPMADLSLIWFEALSQHLPLLLEVLGEVALGEVDEPELLCALAIPMLPARMAAESKPMVTRIMVPDSR